ncbi:HalOD1 output domain-containing protein [Halobaculum roseum]|uniref:HalOD1 output domain-containing protein n=1 Tax=Halobaculum roseum TaxID=2175149 RepID=A0ABD5MIR4_9EURY|nr:HalOD1 output domain-containing protein [Halobaculum roseum]
MAIDENEATVIHAVVASVASVSGTDPIELPPLYDVIDPDALASLCSGRRSDGSDSSVRVSFEYADHLVTVSGCRTATATPLE